MNQQPEMDGAGFAAALIAHALPKASDLPNVTSADDVEVVGEYKVDASAQNQPETVRLRSVGERLMAQVARINAYSGNGSGGIEITVPNSNVLADIAELEMLVQDMRSNLLQKLYSPTPIKTNFELVSRVNDVAGNLPVNEWCASIDSQMKIIGATFDAEGKFELAGELKEMVDGWQEKNFRELIDGAADSLVTIYGLFHRVGVDADAVMAEVCASLMTRFDLTAEDQVKTAAKYKAMGIDTICLEVLYDGVMYYVTKSAYDQVITKADGKIEKFPKNKFLKSYQFRDSNVFSMIPQHVIDCFVKKADGA